MVPIINIVSVIFMLNFANGEIRISLDSNGSRNVWTVRNESSSARITATVPGGIYTDLKLTETLFYRQNDIAYRWVGLEDWTYETTFVLTEEILNKTEVNLVFYGIDTIGNISLNGQHIESVNNMFVRHVVPIKDVAQVGNNTLKVLLTSPIKAANRSREEYGNPVPPDCPHTAQNGECHINFLRKMQASFSWSMSPSVPSVGIWKSVELEAFDTAVVRDVTAKIERVNDTYWYIDASCHYYETFGNFSTPGSFRLTTSLWIDDEKGKNQIFSSDYGYDNVTFTWIAHNDQIWWPNGYGNQSFLNLECKFEADGEISTKQIKIALREIELVQEPSSDKSQPFYFKVNGVPIFAKGANWIPGHILPELGSDEKMLRQTLQSVKDANMNMLRVWGGGVYESDLFYRICDELGILVWQDMMFTNALYPSKGDYLYAVASEVDQQVKRLLGHASLALWSGNDEVQLALAENWFDENNETDYRDDYFELFENTIKRAYDENDDSGLFVISSPSNGLRTVGNISDSQNPNDERFGDVHDMDHSYDPWNFYDSPVVRFASKYGFQSLPSIATISCCSLPGDRNLKSEFSKNRQHVPGGYDEIKQLIQYHFSLPTDDGSANYYNTFVYYSQLSQALATKAQTERYRKNRGNVDNEFSTTMGALYWHLNDVWQAPSWSSIEFGGRWKMLHYYARKFFEPVIIVPEMTSRSAVNVYIVSDLLEDVSCEFSISFYSWNNFQPKYVTANQQVVLNSSSLIYTVFSLPNSMKVTGCSITTCFVHFKLSGNGIFTENFLYPHDFSKITNIAPATLTATASPNVNYPTEIFIDLKADRIIPFIWLETEVEGIFSDNGFTVIEESVQIRFSNRGERIDCEKFKSTITIQSLYQKWAADVTCGCNNIAGDKLGLTAVFLFLMSPLYYNFYF